MELELPRFRGALQASAGGNPDQMARDGEFVRVPMLVTDGDLIDEINDGKVELSPGNT